MATWQSTRVVCNDHSLTAMSPSGPISVLLCSTSKSGAVEKNVCFHKQICECCLVTAEHRSSLHNTETSPSARGIFRNPVYINRRKFLMFPGHNDIFSQKLYSCQLSRLNVLQKPDERIFYATKIPCIVYLD